jgi:hypothetical protein
MTMRRYPEDARPRSLHRDCKRRQQYYRHCPLVEVYDLKFNRRLQVANISTRGLVQTGTTS